MRESTSPPSRLNAFSSNPFFFVLCILFCFVFSSILHDMDGITIKTTLGRRYDPFKFPCMHFIYYLLQYVIYYYHSYAILG